MMLRQAMLAILPMSLIACGSSGGDNTITPEGMHYHFVMDSATVPANSAQARMDGLDLNGDGTVDNQLGDVLATLAGQGFKIQDTLTQAVNEGSIVLLGDYQAPDITMDTVTAGFQVLLGNGASAPTGAPVPAPCNGSADTTCRLQFAGNGMFTVAADSPTDASLGGKTINGTFNGGPGTISLQIALGSTAPIELDLIGARAQLSGLSATGITSGILAGALSQDDLNNKVIPAIHDQLEPLIQRDCCGLATSPGGATCNAAATPACGCTAGSTGAQIISLFDTAIPKDCAVSIMEITTNGFIESLLAPDVTIGGVMALSLGVKVTAVGATYTVAGETNSP